MGEWVLRELQWKLREDCLNGEIFYSLKEARIVIEQWRQQYNRVRPHAAVGYRPPAPGGLYPTLEPGFKASSDHVICLTALGTKSRPGQDTCAQRDIERTGRRTDPSFRMESYPGGTPWLCGIPK